MSKSRSSPNPTFHQRYALFVGGLSHGERNGSDAGMKLRVVQKVVIQSEGRMCLNLKNSIDSANKLI